MSNAHIQSVCPMPSMCYHPPGPPHSIHARLISLALSTSTLIYLLLLVFCPVHGQNFMGKNRPASNLSHWPPGPAVLVPHTVSPVISSSSSKLASMFSSVNLSPSKGLFNCMLSTHHDVTRCNNTYQASLHHIIVRGYKKESKIFRRQFCCGFWSRERCLSDAVQRKCDRATANKFTSEKSPYGTEVDTRHTGISCLGFEQDSALCSRAAGASGLHTSLMGLLAGWHAHLGLVLFVHCLFIF